VAEIPLVRFTVSSKSEREVADAERPARGRWSGDFTVFVVNGGVKRQLWSVSEIVSISCLLSPVNFDH
jgi:hypothetical protein